MTPSQGQGVTELAMAACLQHLTCVRIHLDKVSVHLKTADLHLWMLDMFCAYLHKHDKIQDIIRGHGYAMN